MIYRLTLGSLWSTGSRRIGLSTYFDGGAYFAISLKLLYTILICANLVVILNCLLFARFIIIREWRETTKIKWESYLALTCPSTILTYSKLMRKNLIKNFIMTIFQSLDPNSVFNWKIVNSKEASPKCLRLDIICLGKLLQIIMCLNQLSQTWLIAYLSKLKKW